MILLKSQNYQTSLLIDGTTKTVRQEIKKEGRFYGAMIALMAASLIASI